jgi:hypothetical protein
MFHWRFNTVFALLMMQATVTQAAPDVDLAQLSSPLADVRAKAAASLRKTKEAPPSRKMWLAKMSRFKPGTALAEIVKQTGGTIEAEISGGGGTTATVRLDGYWTVVLVLDDKVRLREIGQLIEASRIIWVEPPASYTGEWLTYFSNGQVAHQIDYDNGQYTKFVAYYDNGQLSYEQHYLDGKIDGTEVGFHRNGTKSYSITHQSGANVGAWTHWYSNGNMQSQQRYVDGKLDGKTTHWRVDGKRSNLFVYKNGTETGQAAWDAVGKLIYARGDAAALAH